MTDKETLQKIKNKGILYELTIKGLKINDYVFLIIKDNLYIVQTIRNKVSFLHSFDTLPSDQQENILSIL